MKTYNSIWNKILSGFFLTLCIFSGILMSPINTYAKKSIVEKSEYPQWMQQKISRKINEINPLIKVGDKFKVDLSDLKEFFKKNSNSNIVFEWTMKGAPTSKGNVFEYTFKEYGNKIININIYALEKNEKKLITTQSKDIFVYKHISYLISDKKLPQKKYKNYIKQSQEHGIYIENILKTTIKEIDNKNVLSRINKSNILQKGGENYITIWGDKDFLLSIVAKINKQFFDNKIETKLNILLISDFNTDVLNNYLRNFLVNKKWIRTVILIPESSISIIRYKPHNIKELEKKLKNTAYEYIHVDTKVEISKWMFVSQFINMLSNKGFSINSIYLLILVPFLLTYISIAKHFIGLSPLGINIPILLTLLFFQIGLIAGFSIFFVFLLLNIVLGKLMSKYTLLYTPKMVFLVIINIIFMIVITMVLIKYNLLHINSGNLLFIILFIVIAEKLITTILSKEFNEYRFSLLNTILFALTSYLFFRVNAVQNILLAYPESIVLLIFINFGIGKFTGLRITEYFRFKEVIHDMEE